MNPQPQLVLASASPRRKQLLESLGLYFKIIPSGIDEKSEAGLSPEQIVLHLSVRKAAAVAEQEKDNDTVIVAADTVVVLEGEVLGQPTDEQEARRMLQRLSGKSHEVFTGVTLLRTGSRRQRESFCERTKVTFAALQEEEIDGYIRSGSPMDKAGAYGIQDDRGSVFVSGIEGDYYNVVGLPLHKFYYSMKKIAPEIFEQAGWQDVS